MSVLTIYKETALPATLTAHSLYWIAPPGSDAKYVEIYMTGATASIVRRVINEADVNSIVNSAIAAIPDSSTLQVVNTIAERDALALTYNTFVYVIDATADSTVSVGGATYVYNVSTSAFTKTSESESMDVILSWDKLQNRPTSSTADIDDAVAKRHTHANMTQLNKITEDADGNIKYGDKYPSAGLASANW
jgi:hypothetical protein